VASCFCLVLLPPIASRSACRIHAPVGGPRVGGGQWPSRDGRTLARVPCEAGSRVGLLLATSIAPGGAHPLAHCANPALASARCSAIDARNSRAAAFWRAVFTPPLALPGLVPSPPTPPVPPPPLPFSHTTNRQRASCNVGRCSAGHGATTTATGRVEDCSVIGMALPPLPGVGTPTGKEPPS